MIQITPQIIIPDHEIDLEFVRASGPGGQNVNKVSTAVQLRFDVANSPSLPDPVRERLSELAGGRITNDGVLVINARRYRTQVRNRQDAVERFVELIREATIKPQQRKRTKPSRAARRKRLEDKRRHSEKKRHRRLRPDID